ncbi:MAG TPA: TIM-barrel domain-containing protein [Candidatus Methylacidiphilales bacterium]
MRSFRHLPSLALAFSLFALANRGAAQAPSGLDANGQIQAITSPSPSGFAFTRLQSGVQIRVGDLTKNVLFYGPSTVRVTAVLDEAYLKQPSIVVVQSPSEAGPEVKESPSALTLSTPKLTVSIDKGSGSLRFLRPDGTEITRERADQPSELKKAILPSGTPTYEVTQTFTLSPDEALYGLGQYEQRPYMNYRGQSVLLVQTNIGITVPLLLSTRRYAILWDIYSKGTFKDGAAGASFWAESAPDGIDYYFVGGETMDGVIAGYRTLTGPAPMYPKQAFGLFMSKERYKTQDEVIDVVKKFRESGFPLDYIVQDWQYWGGQDPKTRVWDGKWSGMTWDPERYPDPAAMAKTLHDDLHVKLMVSIWPSVGDDTDLGRELDSKGLRFPPLHWISKKAHIYDAYSPEGRAIYFKHIKKGLLDVGVDALWMDGTEVEVGGACHDAGGVERDIKSLGKNAMGDFATYLNPYSLLTTKGTYEGQRAADNKRVLTLTRSAFTGQQRYAAMPWSGDTTASWKTLLAQISGGLNCGMAGLPYYTQDTGGFFVTYPKGNQNPEWQELYARWNQFAVFNPVYRIHGTSTPREPYLFKEINPEIYQSLLDAARLRYRLLPYIYDLAWQTTHSGYTMMRGLAMDFPDDPQVRNIDDAYMFGPAFLVHPVTRSMFHVSESRPPTVPDNLLRTPDGKPGLALEYFRGEKLEESASTTVDTKIEHNWPAPPLAELPPGLNGPDHFSARWTGTLTAPEDGEYEFGAEVDDGARVWIDDKLLDDDWISKGKRYKGGRITLAKGQPVSVKLEYFQGTQDRYFRFCWKTPAMIKEQADKQNAPNTTMETYLPAGADWYDFWTNERFAGGRTVKKECPLGIFPLYVRAGSIVPMGPFVHYATERPDAPYEIRIYPGADARATVYEDDNETYDYEKGAYATYDLLWDDAARKLGVGARAGSFPGMIAARRLEVAVAAPGRNAGIDETPATTTAVPYDGAKVEVPLR